MSSWFQRYLLPGLIFQGIVIGGGYATGRELTEFFMPSGPIGGLLGMAVAALLWSLIMAVSFELCRREGSTEYRSFFKSLIGRAWVLYEILYVILMILVLAVVAAAAGELTRNIAGLPTGVGTLALLLIIGLLAFFGSNLIERFMGAWSILLYIVYLSLVVSCLVAFGTDIQQNFSEAEVGGRWIGDGLRYAGYNLAVIPAVFFCLRHLQTRRQALTAGLLAGPIAIVPAVFLYIAMMAAYPSIETAAIPSTVLLERLGLPLFALFFQVVLLGTFIQTGVGLVHVVNERIATTLAEHNLRLPRMSRAIIAVALLSVALGLAITVGIVGLIAHGYGALTYGFMAIFVLPVLTIGLWRITRPYEATATTTTTT